MGRVAAGRSGREEGRGQVGRVSGLMEIGDCGGFGAAARWEGTIGAGGRAVIRITCQDIVPCRLSTVRLDYKKHLASEYAVRGPRLLSPGQSGVVRVRLNRWLRRPGRFKRLTVTATPAATAGGLIAGFPRVITLIRPR